MWGTALGGLGLFLLGMKLMTDGLQAMAGDALRDLLRRYTRTHLRGVFLGAFATAAVQSSSAVTLVTIGFVSAGLLTFGSALGVLYGANLGTTVTAWIVTIIGLKFKVDAFAMPVVGVGAMLAVLGRGRAKQAGMALAGFGLIFAGIGGLQEGLSGLGEQVDPGSWARPGLLGNVVLVLVGMVMTLLLQSSSAAVVATLAAVDAGTVSFPQAAALVIGQNVGTTFKAMLASAGGPIAARRAAFAHLMFNGGTGLVALLLLPLFVLGVDALSTRLDVHDAAVSLSIFHTAFNVVGVLIFLPITDRFALWIERVVPERAGALTRRLVESGVDLPDVRLEASRRTTLDIARAAADLAAATPTRPAPYDAPTLHTAIHGVRTYLDKLHADAGTPEHLRQHLALLRSLDHLQHLVAKGAHPPPPALRDAELDAVGLPDWLEALRDRLYADPTEPLAPFEASAERLNARLRGERDRVLQRTAIGQIDAESSSARLDALRWADRMYHHGSSAVRYLAEASFTLPEVHATAIDQEATA